MLDEERYSCSPSVESCESLIIRNLSLSSLGHYTRSSKSKDRTKSYYYNYFVAGLDIPLRFNCASNKLTICNYDTKTNTLTVKEDADVILNCAAIILKTADNNVEAEIHYEYDGQSECSSQTSRKKNDTQSSRMANLHEIEISSDCPAKFDKSVNKFTCALRYFKEFGRNEAGLEIERLNINVNVHFGPITEQYTSNDTTKSITKSQSLTLKCPFAGNPVEFYWQYMNETEFRGEKELNVANLANGIHNYQCRAKINGVFEESSEKVQFKITVKDQKPKSKPSKSFCLIFFSC